MFTVKKPKIPKRQCRTLRISPDMIYLQAQYVNLLSLCLCLRSLWRIRHAPDIRDEDNSTYMLEQNTSGGQP